MILLLWGYLRMFLEDIDIDMTAGVRFDAENIL